MAELFGHVSDVFLIISQRAIFRCESADDESAPANDCKPLAREAWKEAESLVKKSTYCIDNFSIFNLILCVLCD